MIYRLLEEGEQFQEGDETLDDNCETWSKLDPHFFKAHYYSSFNVPTRRAFSRVVVVVGKSGEVISRIEVSGEKAEELEGQ